MKITRVEHETNKWINRKQTPLEKVLEMAVILAVAFIFCGALLK